ncbi:MAG: pyrroline-5-carboxylate reductase family protein [Sphingobium sp.]
MTTLESFDRPLFLVGCGNMAGAMLARWLDRGLRRNLITVLRPSGRAVGEDIAVVSAFPSVLPENALVMLGMKPQQLADVAPVLERLWRKDILLVSLLAGVTVRRLDMALGGAGDAAIVRVMPNMPVALGKGVCAAFASTAADVPGQSIVERLLAPLGLVEWLDDESGFNLVTALAGCGPAYLYRFVDTLAAAAAALGMEQDRAARLALATVEGAAALAASGDVDPGTLADRVASKGGMTREGLDVMDEGDRLLSLMTDVLRAARDRGEELDRLSG